MIWCIKWLNRYDIATNSSANDSAIDKVIDMEITNAANYYSSAWVYTMTSI